jgi:NAD-dependent deacetylase sirtuin 5
MRLIPRGAFLPLASQFSPLRAGSPRTMTTTSTLDPTMVEDFRRHLERSTRILALLGAGMSASSGLPTFRGAGGLWRTHDAVSLATPTAFRADPALVWQFYSYRRHMAMNAKPNRAHLALAELSRKNPKFITLSQNVDGLSPRAGHPAEQLKLLHGNLFDVKCFNEACGYLRKNDFTDPIVPALALPSIKDTTANTTDQVPPNTDSHTAHATKKHALLTGADISDISIPIPRIPLHDLPSCPQCKSQLLRPGVVWFGESLPTDVLSSVDDFIDAPERIDLMLVIGTSSVVYPAAGYTEIARSKGARVAVINMDKGDAKGMTKRDWLFQGDAAEILPELLKDLIGETPTFEEWQQQQKQAGKPRV